MKVFEWHHVSAEGFKAHTQKTRIESSCSRAHSSIQSMVSKPILRKRGLKADEARYPKHAIVAVSKPILRKRGLKEML